jgi:uncharacterized protein YjiS (DUF1127 family)
VKKMSNSDVFGSPMILTGNRPVSPFGAALYNSSSVTAAAKTGRRTLQVLCNLLGFSSRDQRIRKTVLELSKLDNRTLRDIGLDRTVITRVAQEIAETRDHSVTRRFKR